nr:hypothetical protein [Paracoccus homiensis]
MLGFIEAVGMALPAASFVSGCLLKLHPLNAHRRRDGFHDLAVHGPAVLGRLHLDHISPSVRKTDHKAICGLAGVSLHLTSKYATVAQFIYATVEAWLQ